MKTIIGNLQILLKQKSLAIPDCVKRVSSCQVGMEFYRRCVGMGMCLRSEYKLKNCRFDAVLVKHGHVILIIEYKNFKKERTSVVTRQSKKYSQFGVDILYVLDMSKIFDCLNIAKMYWDAYEDPRNK